MIVVEFLYLGHIWTFIFCFFQVSIFEKPVWLYSGSTGFSSTKCFFSWKTSTFFQVQYISKHNFNFQIYFFNFTPSSITVFQISLNSCPNVYLWSITIAMYFLYCFPSLADSKFIVLLFDESIYDRMGWNLSWRLC